MKNPIKFFAPGIILLCGIMLCRQGNAQVILAAELRPRTEFRNGFKTLRKPGEAPAFFTEQRSRLSASYQTKIYKASLVFQDVRIWGETGQINKTDALTSLHEGWAEVYFGNKVAIKAGRQELVYDDHRILGNLDWATQARSHDALLVKFSDSTFFVHLGLAYNQDARIPEPTKLSGNFYSTPSGFNALGGGLPNYKTMQYLWFQKLFGRSHVSGLILNSGWQLPDTTVNYLLTAGLNPSIILSNRFKLSGSFYYQAGNDRANKSVNAWLASATLQYSGIAKAPTSIGADFVSGSRVASANSKTFDPLFGTHHAFYGHMDYFYVGNPHTQQGNTIGLIDVFAKTTILTSPKSSVLLHLHEFRSQVPLIDPETPSASISSRLGNEIDMIFNYDCDKAINLKVGYSQMFATRSMEAIKGGDKDKMQSWAWCMLTVKPTLIYINDLK